MVGLVSGTSLGLENTSLRTLGHLGPVADASYGARTEQAYVNVATGNLVLQNRDEWFMGVGGNTSEIRTYNSLGVPEGASANHWVTGQFTRRLSIEQAGDRVTISRYAPDGAGGAYIYDPDSQAYVSTDGEGAYDTITEDPDLGYVWHDGATGARERYLADGTIAELSDDQGNLTRFQYVDGRLDCMLNEANEGFRFTYNSAGRLASVRFQALDGTESVRTYYAYDGLGRLTKVFGDLSPDDKSTKDGNQLITAYSYDGDTSRLASVTQRDGSGLRFTYVQVGVDHRVETVTDTQGASTRFDYDAPAGITRVTGPGGVRKEYVYDAVGQLTRIAVLNASGQVASTSFEYNAQGDLTAVVDPLGQTSTMRYDARGNRTYERNHDGEVVERAYDAANRLTRETRYWHADPDGDGAGVPSGALTAGQIYEAGPGGKLRFQVSAEGRVVERRYGAFGLLESTWEYLTTMPLDNVGDLNLAELDQWATTRRGEATRTDYKYDHRGQVETKTTWRQTRADGTPVVEAGGETTRYTYDHLGQLLQTTDPSGANHFYVYDGAGRLQTETNALGETTRYDYGGGSGRYLAIHHANGLLTTRYFDRRGQTIGTGQTADTGEVLARTYLWYDGRGNPVMTKDAVGSRTWMLYDAADRKIADIDSRGCLTEYVHDGNGHLIQTIQYEMAVDVALLLDPVTGLASTPTLSSLRPNLGADRRTWYVHDAAGRVVRTVVLDDAASKKAKVAATYYDAAGRAQSTVDFNALLDTSGWGAGVTAGVATPPASDADRKTRHFYDADGLRIGTIDGEGFLTHYVFDGAGRVIVEKRFALRIDASLANGSLDRLVPQGSPDDQITRFFRDRMGRVAGVLDAEGYLVERTYDVAGNQIKSVRYATRVAQPDHSKTALANLRPTQTREDEVSTWEYDRLNRQIRHTDGRGLRTQYVYDKAGNVVETVMTDSRGDRRAVLARYDLQGRLTAELSPLDVRRLEGITSSAEAQAVWAQYASKYTYDAAGNRTSATDTAGNRTVYYYAPSGIETFRVSALGAVTQKRLDQWGRSVAEGQYGTLVSPLELQGGVDNSRPTRAAAAVASSALDSWVRRTYRLDGAISTEIDEAGGLTSWEYNAFGQLASSTLRMSASKSYVEEKQYDRRGLLTSQTLDAGGQAITTRYAHDAFGRVTSETDSLGRTRTFSYDRLGRMIAVTDAAGESRTTYDAFDRTLRTVDATGSETVYRHDRENRTLAVTSPDGVLVTTEFDQYGKVVAVTDGRNLTSTYAYDAAGNQTSVTRGGVTTNSRYRSDGVLVESSDEAGIRTVYEYDAANRMVRRRVMGGAAATLITSYQYDAKGQQFRVTDPAGSVTEYTYDLKGRLVRSVVDPDGLKLGTSYSHDVQDNVLTVTDSRGSVTRYFYDKLGRRLAEVVDSGGLNLTRNFRYDKVGNLISSSVPGGGNTRFAYDDLNREIFRVDPVGAVRETRYDAMSRVVETREYGHAVSLAEVDLQLTPDVIRAQLFPDGAVDRCERRFYSADGLLAASMDATGAVRRFVYDKGGNVVRQERYSVADAEGLAGLPQPATPQDVVVERYSVYDNFNRPAFIIDGAGGVTAFSYDACGRVTCQVQYAQALSLPRSMELADLALDVKALAGTGRTESIRNVYDGAGRLTWRVDGEGGVTRHVYDGGGNVVEKVVYATPVDTSLPTSDAHLSAAVRPSATDQRTINRYDSAGRLEWTVDGTGAAVRFRYDANGNLATRTHYAEAQELASFSPANVMANALDRQTRYCHDAANRLIYTVDALGGVTENIFDAVGNMTREIRYAEPIGPSTIAAADIRLSLRPGGADRIVQHAYDAAGRRVYSANAEGAVTETRHTVFGQAEITRQYATTIAHTTLGANASMGAWRTLLTTNAQDRVTSRVHDAAGRVIYTVDPENAIIEQRYDGAGRVEFVRMYANAPGSRPSATEAAVREAIVVDTVHDRIERYRYDGAGRMAVRTDAHGAEERFGYDGVGRRTSRTDAMGSRWTFAYDAAGRLKLETSPPVERFRMIELAGGDVSLEGGLAPATISTAYDYDGAGNLRSRTEAAGLPEQRTFTYEYDALGRRVASTLSGARVYDGSTDDLSDRSNSARHEVTRDLTERTRFSVFGDIVAVTDAAGGTSYREYDRAGRLHVEVDALGYAVVHGRNAFGDDESVLWAANAAVVHADPGGQPSVELPAPSEHDRLTTFRFDRMGRLIEAIEKLDHAFDASSGNLLLAPTHGITTTFNAFGEVRTVVDGAAATVHLYDRNGRETGTVDAEGYLTSQAYDPLGNLISRTEHAKVLSKWSLFAARAGVVPSTPASAEEDRGWTYRYDALGRRLEETMTGVAAASSLVGTSSATVVFEPPSAPRFQFIRGAPLAIGSIDVGLAPNAQGCWVQWSSPLQGSTTFRWRVAGTGVWNDASDQVQSAGGLQTFVFALDMPAGAYEVEVINDLNGQWLAQGQGTVVVSSARSGSIQLAANAVSGASPVAGLSTASMDGGPIISWSAPTPGHTVEFRWRLAGSTDWLVGNVQTPPGGSTQHVVVPADMVAGTYEIQLVVTRHGTEQKQATSRWSYDALGNVTLHTDAESGETYRYYDALGRLTATITPAVDDMAGLPLTQFAHDAHGNQLGVVARARGATNVSLSGYVAASPDAADRAEVSRFDAQGRRIQTTNAVGVSTFYSYDAAGRLAKSWQTVETESGLAVAYQVFRYDAAGRLTEQVEPGANGTGDSTASTLIGYDAFGNMTSRTVSGAETEWWRYDVSGRLWSTNEGDGVERVTLYDLQGRATMDIRSAGAVNMRSFQAAVDAWQSSGTRRTITHYDLLGRVVGQTSANTIQVDGAAEVVHLRAGRGAVVSASPQFGIPRWAGASSVQLSWTDLTMLGSGDVKVELSYVTKGYTFAGEDIRVAPEERVLTRTFTSEQAATGVRLEWTDHQDAGGIDGVRGFSVYKKDRDGQWQRVIHQARQEAAVNLLVIKAPDNPADAVTVQWKAAGVPSSGFKSAGTLMRFGDSIAFDLADAPDGRYDYEVWTQPAGTTQLVRTSAGTLALSPAPLASIAQAVQAKADEPGILAWPRPSASTQQTWRYRTIGESVWRSLPVQDRSDGSSCVDIRHLPSGQYEFELLHAGATGPFAHSIGKFEVNGPVGIDAAFTANADGSATIGWPRRDDVETAFRYRPVGAASWEKAAPSDFAIDVAAARQSVRILLGKVPGPYDIELQFLQGGQLIASQSGIVTVRATAVRPDLVDSTVVVDTNQPATLTSTANVLGTAARLDVRFSTQADGTWQLEWPQPSSGLTIVRYRHELSTIWYDAPPERIFTGGGWQRVQVMPADWLPGTWEVDIRQEDSRGQVVARTSGAVTVHPPVVMLQAFGGTNVGASVAGNASTGEWWITTKAPEQLGAYAIDLLYRRSGTNEAYSSVRLPAASSDGKVRFSVLPGQVLAGTEYEVRLVYQRAGLPGIESNTRICTGSGAGLPDAVELRPVPVTLENHPDGTWSLAWPRPVEGVTSQVTLTRGGQVEALPLTRNGSSETYHDSDVRPPGSYQIELVQMRGGVRVGLYKGTLQVPDDVISALPLARTARGDGSWSLAWSPPAAGLVAHAEFGFASSSFRVNRDGWIRQQADGSMAVTVGAWDVVGEAWDLVAEDAVVNVYLQASDGRRVSQASTLVRLREPIRSAPGWLPASRSYAVTMADAGSSPPISAAHEIEWGVRSSASAPVFSTTASGGSRFDWDAPMTNTPVFRYRLWGESDWRMPVVQRDSVLRAFAILPATLGAGDYEFQLLEVADIVVNYSFGTLRVPRAGGGGPASVASQLGSQQTQSLTLQARVQQQLDRWGNTVRMTDPRQNEWATTFRYDRNDRLIEESRPGAAGETAAARRITSWMEHDALGRLTASTDANGHTNRQRWDRAGNLLGEVYADGTAVTYRYDLFGDRIARIDELNVLTAYRYDALSRLRVTTHAATNNYRFDISNDVWGLMRDGAHPTVTEAVDYDRAGRKSRQINGAGEQTLYRYDVRGNLAKVTQGGLTTEWRYDNRGRRLSQTDGEGATATWWYDNFRVKGRTDIGGATYAYTYDHANQLTREVSNVTDVTRRKDIAYAYDAAGQLVRQVDASTNKISEYVYDLAGNRIAERTRQGMVVNGVARHVTYQDNELAYDALGRLRWVADGRARVEIDYDQIGNRTRIQTHVINGDTSQDADLHFQYDVRDRQVIANASNRHGALGTSGHRMAYDKAGNKVSDAWQGPVVVKDPLGNYRAATGLTNEVYARDALGRITVVKRDGVQIDRRHYDAAGRVVQSGVTGLSEDYLGALNGRGADGKPLEGNGTELRQSLFDGNGGLRMQQVLNRSGDNFKYRTVYYDEANPTALNTDKAGNLLGYAVVNRETNENTAYTYTYERADGYRQTDLDVVNRTTGKSGHSDFFHDGNGYMVRVEDLKQAANNRDLVNDAEGRLLYANQGGHVQRQLVANGEVFGRFGEVADEAVPRSRNGVSTYKSIADFDFAFAPAAGKPGQLTPSSHVVSAGDTLQSIAHTAYGDSRLWYRIAEANGVLKNSELMAGQVLTLPQLELSLNGASTFKPYDASSAIGDTSPHVPLPSPKKSHWFGQLLAVVVTIIASVYTAGLFAAGPGAGLLGTLHAGVGSLASGSATLTATVTSAAAGSVAGQVVGVASGAQEKFSWKGVALSAVTAGIGHGVPGNLLGAGNPVSGAMAKAAITNTASQAVAVAIGAQSKFDWHGVAAAGVGAGVGQSISDPLVKAVESRFMGGLLAGLVAGGAAAAARGRRVAVGQVAMDAFGNALRSSLADAKSLPGSTTPSGGSGGEYDDTWRSQNLARMHALAAGTPVDGGIDWVANTSAMGPSAEPSLMFSPTQLIGGGRNAQGLRYYEWGGDGVTAVATEVPQSVLAATELPPLAVEDTGLRFGSSQGDASIWSRSSAYDYWTRVQDEGGFFKYALGGTMRTLSGVGYDVDEAVSGADNPWSLLNGAKKGFVNFGPELFNGAANGVKLTLNGYSRIAEKLGLGEGTFAGFRESSPYNITPLYSYDNKTEAGVALLTNFAMAGAASRYGSYAIEFDAASAGTTFANPTGLRLVSPRYQPGVVTYGDDLVPASGNWLDPTIPTPVPLQVAKQLEGKSFNTFGELKSAVWQAVAADADLNAVFRKMSFQEMLAGRAPFAPPAFANEQFGHKFNLHHIDQVGRGGAVYDLSNIRIVSPRLHSEIHY